ncbi:phosphoserine phosphatase SerB [Sneathiella limimaris]|uniref:phosphoserine phosphatase SerB n=1 Tax=Sneathiella limimaris TaxID=1964213 RepID=UPI00146C4F9A|nr:phosphoserine phosphatase SerB [Sneathiella limimaris]
MNSVLTLVADPANPSSFPNTIAAVKARLQALGIMDLKETWLKQDFALDLEFDGTLAKDDIQEAADACDFCLQGTEDRRKKLLLADMDSTIITVECIDELADFAGIKEQVSAITEQAMRGELDFNEAFIARVGMLKGLPENVLEKTFEERVRLTPGARTLIQTVKKQNGTYTALVSGGFTYFTGKVRALTGFDMDDANELVFEGGKLTGKAKEPIVNSETKLENLKRLTKELGLTPSQTLAVGDGANDIPMIEAAGLGIAFHAKPKAQAAANAAIRHGDLTVLLYYQGYKAEEFVDS